MLSAAKGLSVAETLKVVLFWSVTEVPDQAILFATRFLVDAELQER
jgi:hypothetical protein